MNSIFKEILSSGGAYLLTAVAAYLLGSISFAVIFTKLFIGRDIREFGSGNAGATNVFRSVGIRAGILTFVCDFAKGAAAILLGRLIFKTFAPAGLANEVEMSQLGACIAGLFALLGHIYPVFFGFRGGKGIMTAGGIIFVLSWKTFLLLFLLFIVIFLITRIVSVGSITIAAVYPMITAYINIRNRLADPVNTSRYSVIMQIGISVVMAAIVIYMHRTNIARILSGTESKMVFKRMGKVNKK